MKFFVEFWCFWGVFNLIDARGLPPYLKICKRNDPQLRRCVTDNIDILRPRLKTGVPDLFLPSLDPLVIPEATLTSGNNFRATFKNIELHRADNFTLKEFDVDLEKYKVTIDILFPSVRIKSDYRVNGRLLILNLDGHGPADGNYTNIEASMSLKGAPYRKNDKEHVRWEKERIDLHIEKVNLLFERIFGQNVELNEQTNRVINQNVDGIIEELNPVIQQVVSDFVFGLINRLFAKYSINELFPVA